MLIIDGHIVYACLIWIGFIRCIGALMHEIKLGNWLTQMISVQTCRTPIIEERAAPLHASLLRRTYVSLPGYRLPVDVSPQSTPRTAHRRDAVRRRASKQRLRKRAPREIIFIAYCGPDPGRRTGNRPSNTSMQIKTATTQPTSPEKGRTRLAAASPAEARPRPHRRRGRRG
jgi:hypothetical protein